ncbi:hypothetical protein KUCAC02_037747, partial [Chaenocephalus aceratus]
RNIQANFEKNWTSDRFDEGTSLHVSCRTHTAWVSSRGPRHVSPETAITSPVILDSTSLLLAVATSH